MDVYTMGESKTLSAVESMIVDWRGINAVADTFLNRVAQQEVTSIFAALKLSYHRDLDRSQVARAYGLGRFLHAMSWYGMMGREHETAARIERHRQVGLVVVDAVSEGLATLIYGGSEADRRRGVRSGQTISARLSPALPVLVAWVQPIRPGCARSPGARRCPRQMIAASPTPCTSPFRYLRLGLADNHLDHVIPCIASLSCHILSRMRVLRL